MIINVAVIFIPAILTIVLAFYRWDGISEPTFIGLGNFERLWDDRIFWKALKNNIIWTALFLTFPIIVGLIAASLMLTVRRGSTLFQVIYLIPLIISAVITARVWQGMIYNPQSGIVGLLNRFGIEVYDPLSRTATALYGVAVVDKKDKITELAEKPKKPKTNLAVTGLYFFDNKVISLSKKLKPSKRKEIEIIDLLIKYKNNKKLKADYLGRGGVWLDTGSVDDFYNASDFISTIEKRQGLKIACLEEIALKNKWIGKKEIIKSIKFYGKCEYSNYLISLI